MFSPTVATVIAVAIAAAALACLGAVMTMSRRERVERRNRQLAREALVRNGDDAGGAQSRFALMLEQAGVKTSPVVTAASMAVVALGAAYVAGSWFGTAGVVVAVVALAAAAWIALRAMRRRRAGAFEAQLRAILPMIVEGIRAGSTFERAAMNAAEYMDDPCKGEFERFAAERSYGVPLEAAVENMASRQRSRDMEMLAAIIGVNARTGGNLAGVLTSVSESMSRRAHEERHRKSVTAMSRASAWVLTAIPFVVAGLLLLVGGDYMLVPFEVPFGWLVYAVPGALILIGTVIIHRLCNFDIN